MIRKPAHSHKLPDIHQNAWQLASIQLVSLINFPVFITSLIILNNIGFYNSLVTITAGSVILFVIRWVIILMSFEGRKSAIDLSAEYLGSYGKYFIAIVVLLANLIWFIKITNLGSMSIETLIPTKNQTNANILFKYSTVIGLCSTLFCLKGIKLIKNASLIFLPLILLSILVITFLIKNNSFSLGSIDPLLAFSYLPIYLGIHLGATSDLPTFFRHSDSKKSSFRALIIIQVMSLALGICSLYFGALFDPEKGSVNALIANSNNIMIYSALILIIFTTIGTNFANIYSASVGWELIIELLPKNKISKTLVGPQEWFILGLGAIILFVFSFDSPHIDIFLEVVDNSLVNFSLVLFLSYLFSLTLSKLNASFLQQDFMYKQKQFTLFLSWLIASLINTLQITNLFLHDYSVLLTGIFLISAILIPFNLFKLVSTVR